MQDQRIDGMRVAALTETEFIPKEMNYYAEHFPRLGATVDFATNLWGQPSRVIVADSHERRGDAADDDRESRRRHAALRDYDIVIQAANYTAVRLREIPPMGSHGSIEAMREVPAVKFYADAMRDKRIVKGALCHGLWILTPCPELLRGHKVMCHTSSSPISTTPVRSTYRTVPKSSSTTTSSPDVLPRISRITSRRSS